MTPKEKAEDLFYKMLKNSISTSDESALFRAKQNALIAVNEILSAVNVTTENAAQGRLVNILNSYFQQVKQEIEKL